MLSQSQMGQKVNRPLVKTVKKSLVKAIISKVEKSRMSLTWLKPSLTLELNLFCKIAKTEVHLQLYSLWKYTRRKQEQRQCKKPAHPSKI